MGNHKKRGPIENCLSILTTVIHTKDEYTFVHCREVGNICNKFGEFLKLDKEMVNHLKMAGYIHDIGKVFVDEGILLKPMALSHDEYEKIKKHSEIGANLIHHMDELMFLYPSILYHHERWDGMGYPKKLKGYEIPITSRILSICDCYHALISDRPYRKGMPKEKITEILMNERGRQFDPQMLDLFFDFILTDDITAS